jgi:hypothetical protein
MTGKSLYVEAEDIEPGPLWVLIYQYNIKDYRASGYILQLVLVTCVAMVEGQRIVTYFNETGEGPSTCAAEIWYPRIKDDVTAAHPKFVGLVPQRIMPDETTLKRLEVMLEAINTNTIAAELRMETLREAAGLLAHYLRPRKPI